MNKNIFLKKKIVSSWFSFLQEAICEEFQKIEIDFGKKFKKKPKYFLKKNWKKSKNQGGGTYARIKNGIIFDSVGVNFSEVSGKFNKKFKSQILGANKNPNYWASGISVVAHMKNPFSNLPFYNQRRYLLYHEIHPYVANKNIYHTIFYILDNIFYYVYYTLV